MSTSQKNKCCEDSDEVATIKRVLASMDQPFPSLRPVPLSQVGKLSAFRLQHSRAFSEQQFSAARVFGKGWVNHPDSQSHHLVWKLLVKHKMIKQWVVFHSSCMSWKQRMNMNKRVQRDHVLDNLTKQLRLIRECYHKRTKRLAIVFWQVGQADCREWFNTRYPYLHDLLWNHRKLGRHKLLVLYLQGFVMRSTPPLPRRKQDYSQSHHHYSSLQ